jgi:hypothetical protein
MADRLNVPGINPFTPQERVNQGVRDEVPNPPDAFRNDPGYDPVPASPVGRFIQDKLTSAKGELSSYITRDKLIAPYLKAASGLGNATDAEKSAARAMIRRITQMSVPELNALAKQDSPTAVAAVEGTSIPARMQPTAAPDSLGNNAGPEYEPGIAAAPGAKLVNPVVPGAPRTAPQGGGTNTLPSGARPSPSMGQPSLRDIQAMAGETGASSAAQPESALDRYAKMLEAQGNDSAKERKDAKAMAIVQAGLGMMGGTSPNAFANIAQGAMPAIQSYQQALQGLRKDDRDRIKQLMEMGLGKEKLAMELKKLGIEDKKADAMVNYYNARAGSAGSGGSKNELTEKQERELYIRANGAVNKIRGEYNKATSDATYKMNAQIVNNPKAKPEQRERAQAYINNVDSQYKPALQEAMEIANLYKPASMQTAGGAGAGGTPKITNQAEYNKLEKGQQYIDPNGVLRTKG